MEINKANLILDVNIIKCIVPQGKLLLKEIDRNDLENVRILRNSCRMFFVNHNLISTEQQVKWYEKYQQTTDIMFSIFLEECWVGSVSIYNIQEDIAYAEFGRLMIDNTKCTGLGKYVTDVVCKYAFDILNIKKLSLEVYTDNIKAYKIYQNIGFKEVSNYSINNKSMKVMELLKDNYISIFDK